MAHGVTRRFELFYSYSQIAVFRPSLANPFNDWTKRHVAQGFSWREGSVSFSTLDETGRAQITVEDGTAFVPEASAERAIVVPFEIDSDGKVECAAISESRVVEMQPGKYALHFETGRNNDATPWIRFFFVPQEAVEARILLTGPRLTPQYPLLMGAVPAV